MLKTTLETIGQREISSERYANVNEPWVAEHLPNGKPNFPDFEVIRITQLQRDDQLLVAQGEFFPQLWVATLKDS